MKRKLTYIFLLLRIINTASADESLQEDMDSTKAALFDFNNNLINLQKNIQDEQTYVSQKISDDEAKIEMLNKELKDAFDKLVYEQIRNDKIQASKDSLKKEIKQNVKEEIMQNLAEKVIPAIRAELETEITAEAGAKLKIAEDKLRAELETDIRQEITVETDRKLRRITADYAQLEMDLLENGKAMIEETNKTQKEQSAIIAELQTKNNNMLKLQKDNNVKFKKTYKAKLKTRYEDKLAKVIARISNKCNEQCNSAISRIKTQMTELRAEIQVLKTANSLLEQELLALKQPVPNQEFEQIQPVLKQPEQIQPEQIQPVQKKPEQKKSVPKKPVQKKSEPNNERNFKF